MHDARIKSSDVTHHHPTGRPAAAELEAARHRLLVRYEYQSSQAHLVVREFSCGYRNPYDRFVGLSGIIPILIFIVSLYVSNFPDVKLHGISQSVITRIQTRDDRPRFPEGKSLGVAVPCRLVQLHGIKNKKSSSSYQPRATRVRYCTSTRRTVPVLLLH